MTVYLEIAERLKQEIQTAEAHLADLKTALAAMQPLITVEMGGSGSSIKALGYSTSITDVTDAELIHTESGDISTSDPHVGEVNPAKKRRAKRRAIGSSVVTEKTSKGPKSKTSPDKLPATSGIFWMNVMGKRPYSLADIVERAIAKLEVTEAARPVLTNRLSAWLYPSMKAGKIQPASPKGKLKRYQLVAV